MLFFFTNQKSNPFIIRTTFGGKRQNDEKNLVENGKTAKKIWWKTAKPLF